MAEPGALVKLHDAADVDEALAAAAAAGRSARVTSAILAHAARWWPPAGDPTASLDFQWVAYGENPDREPAS